MSEPTPLTAASLANIELEIKAREGNGETRQDDSLFLRLLATIAELQRGIEGYRQALEKAEWTRDLWEEVVLGTYMQWSETHYAAQFHDHHGMLGRYLNWVFEERTLDDKDHQFRVRADYEAEMLADLVPALEAHFGVLAGKEAQGD